MSFPYGFWWEFTDEPFPATEPVDHTEHVERGHVNADGGKARHQAYQLPMLISLEAAKADLQMDHAEDDEDITRKIQQASVIVMNYLKLPLDHYADSFGAIPTEDSSNEPDVPHEVRAATTLMLRELYGDAKQRTQWRPGYIPDAVMALLYPLRDPAIG